MHLLFTKVIKAREIGFEKSSRIQKAINSLKANEIYLKQLKPLVKKMESREDVNNTLMLRVGLCAEIGKVWDEIKGLKSYLLTHNNGEIEIIDPFYK